MLHFLPPINQTCFAAKQVVVGCEKLLLKTESSSTFCIKICTSVKGLNPGGHFISWLSMIVRVNVVLNRTVVVDSVEDVNLYMLRGLQVVCALRLRCIVDSKFSRWWRRSRNFAGYMLCFSIDTVLSLDCFSRFHKLIFV